MTRTRSVFPVSSSRNEQCAKHCRPPILEVDFPLQPVLQKSLDSLLRFRPRKRSLKGSEGFEEAIREW